MAIDTTSPRTRRAILLGALGGAAASVAAAVSRANPVRANDTDPVLVGGSYTGTQTTAFDTQASGAGALSGYSGTSTGVQGGSATGMGVIGSSGSNYGVYGIGGVTQPAIFGQSGSNTGVLGFSGDPSEPPNGHANTGVFGDATTNASSVGVRGQSPLGTGVLGSSSSGRGGVFTGGKAQLKLTPSASSHPSSGQAGDLFVDSGHHLWFCKGGIVWVKLA